MFEAPRQHSSAVARAGNIPTGPAPLAEIDFRAIAAQLWSGRTTVLCTTIVALLLAVAFVLVVPHKFTAVTQILIEPTDLRAVGTEATPTTQLSDAAELQVASQVKVLSSDTVLRRVVASQGLDHDPEFAGPSLLRELLASLGIGAKTAADKTLTALNELQRHVQVKRDERTYVIEIDVASKDPEKAARLANAIAQAYLAEQTDIRADAARQVSQSLSARLTELQSRVREAEDRVEAYKAANNIVDANGQLVDEQQLAEMSAQLGAARGRTADAKARLDQIEAVQKAKIDIGAFPAAVQSPTITALRTQYAAVMSREAEAMITLGAKHPAVIDIEAQADRLHHMIDDEVNRIAVSARTEYDTAKANEDALSRQFDALKQRTLTTNQAMVGLRELERTVQASRAVYEAFLVRAKETGEQEQLDTKNIRIISKADLPQRRSWPPSNLILALGAVFLGAAAGSGIVLLRPLRQEAPSRGRGRAAAASSNKPLLPGVPVLAAVPGVDVSFGLDAIDDPRSPFGVEIRNVYEAVRANHKKRHGPSVLVVACDDADETAAVAPALAAVAASRERVLLIDADLAGRTLAAVDADLGDGGGLVDVAVGRRRLSDVVTRDRDTNINLLPLASPASRRDGPISDAAIKDAFDETRRFDMVIVAAVDAGRDPSARFFAGLVDHIIIVVRADAAEAAAAERFIIQLGLDARKVRGAVLINA